MPLGQWNILQYFKFLVTLYQKYYARVVIMQSPKHCSSYYRLVILCLQIMYYPIRNDKKKWKSRLTVNSCTVWKKLRSWRKTMFKSPKFISHTRSNSRNVDKYQPRFFTGSVALINNYTWYTHSICDTYFEEYLVAHLTLVVFSRGYSSYRVWNSQFTIRKVKNRKKIWTGILCWED